MALGDRITEEQDRGTLCVGLVPLLWVFKTEGEGHTPRMWEIFGAEKGMKTFYLRASRKASSLVKSLICLGRPISDC